MAAVQKRKIFTILKYLFFLGLGIVLLWLSFRKLDMTEVWTDIKGANYYWLIVALVLAIASHIFRALRWNLLINSLNYKTKLSTTFYAVMIGYMANTAVPRMGELARCGVLSKKEKIPFNALFGTVISERLFDLITLGAIIVLVIFFQFKSLSSFMANTFGPFFHSLTSNINSLIIFSVVSVLVIVLVYIMIRALKEKIKKLPFYQKLKEFFDGLWDGI